ncbi:hypothetical protein HD_1522 [[Haemophilus] ducreyi 35000HP]|uniref:Transcriptional regulator n=1 Tax=Haemophilus ducreyi (strain 35000HP / ATCC 700724) TaxID=233412 RepID=Q7VLD7_HAEDU|nr:hypothetical protein HD_1522 [[Haemophilus] ducreyi 35000HP]
MLCIYCQEPDYEIRLENDLIKNRLRAVLLYLENKNESEM